MTFSHGEGIARTPNPTHRVAYGPRSKVSNSLGLLGGQYRGVNKKRDLWHCSLANQNSQPTAPENSRLFLVLAVRNHCSDTLYAPRNWLYSVSIIRRLRPRIISSSIKSLDHAMPASGEKHQRLSRRSPFYVLGFAFALLIFSYFGTYLWITRGNQAKLDEYGIHGVLYVSFDEVLRTKDLSRHYRRAMVFAPANWLDQNLLGGDGPTNITFDIN
jgi:hypothetical protein